MSILCSIHGAPLSSPLRSTSQTSDAGVNKYTVTLCRDLAPRMMPMAACAMAPLYTYIATSQQKESLTSDGADGANRASRIHAHPFETQPKQVSAHLRGKAVDLGAESLAVNADEGTTSHTRDGGYAMGKRLAPGRDTMEVVALVSGVDLGSCSSANACLNGQQRQRCHLHRPATPLPLLPRSPQKHWNTSRVALTKWRRGFGLGSSGLQLAKKAGPLTALTPLRDRRPLLTSVKLPANVQSDSPQLQAHLALSLVSDFHRTEVEVMYEPWKVGWPSRSNTILG
jgi:hypothetical protein